MDSDKLKQKRRVFHALLAKNMMLEAKGYMLESYGVHSSLELGECALDELISRLRRILGEKEADTDKEVRRLRHKCLRIMTEIGIDTQDWERVNKFMLNPRVAGRHLYDLNEDDLRQLRLKLYAIRDEVERRRINKEEIRFKELRQAALN